MQLSPTQSRERVKGGDFVPFHSPLQGAGTASLLGSRGKAPWVAFLRKSEQKTRKSEKHVEMRADEKAREYMPEAEEATEEDWGKEYLDYIVSIKTVSSIDEAIAHINHYNTKHSEAIITNNYTHAQKFLDEIDAAVVYVNASTRFTDGFEFGYGAEIGISTQKLHARGPMGLLALTSIKNIVYGTGQIRK